MKKVKMIVTNRFDPDPRVYKEAKYLISKGNDVEILCWDRENEYLERGSENIDGIDVKRFYPYSRYGSGMKQVGAYLAFKKQVKQYLKNKDYDYIHCHDLDGIIIGSSVDNKECKLIFDMHENYEVNGKNQKIRYAIRAIVNYYQNKSDYIIYVNEQQKNFMSHNNKLKCMYLPNYPNVDVFKCCTKSSYGKLRISYIGAVRQYAELKKLMDACKDMEDISINIHGAGVAYERLNKIKDEYRNVKITGKYDFKQSARLYSEADLLYVIYPTSSMQYLNSYPVKFFEAILTKTPVIVGKNTVLEKFVKKHDIGFVVDGDNVDDVKKLIRYINENKYILQGKTKNLEKIQYNYCWEEVVKILDNIY